MYPMRLGIVSLGVPHSPGIGSLLSLNCAVSVLKRSRFRLSHDLSTVSSTLVTVPVGGLVRGLGDFYM
jgi:hypothetical protein